MKGYKSVGVTKHKAPNNRWDQARNQRFRQKNRTAQQLLQSRKKVQPNEVLVTVPLNLNQNQEVAL